MNDPKFTSFTTVDFLSDIDMDRWIEFVEATSPEWSKQMKSRGLIKWQMTRIWNKGEVYRLIVVFEYESKAAFEANQDYLNNVFANHPTNRELMVTAKVSANRGIVIMDA
jgi:hypothetical protein